MSGTRRRGARSRCSGRQSSTPAASTSRRCRTRRSSTSCRWVTRYRSTRWCHEASTSGRMASVPTLGELERAVMETLWSATAPVTARDVQDGLAGRDLATTTVLTVLGRLERKGLVTRERDGRAHRYRAVASREDHVAELMRDALDAAPDRGAALARFLGSIPADERAALRELLD